MLVKQTMCQLKIVTRRYTSRPGRFNNKENCCIFKDSHELTKWICDANNSLENKKDHTKCPETVKIVIMFYIVLK